MREARALEIAEFRTERMCLKLEEISKEMRIAAAAMMRLSRAIVTAKSNGQRSNEEMPSTEVTTTYRMTDAEASGSYATLLTSGIIVIVDGSDVPTGELRQVNAAGVVPTKVRSVVESVVADPGDGNDIDPPADGSDFSCAITTAGAETRVLATPTRLLQTALITFAVDVGDFTMDNASGWDDSGASGNLATFADAGDAFLLVALGIAAATDWRVLAKKGVALA